MLLNHAAFGQAEVVRFGDDQVVVDGNARNLAGLGELAGDPDVLPAWFGIAGGVLVRENNCGRVGQNCSLEDLAWLDKQGIRIT